MLTTDTAIAQRRVDDPERQFIVYCDESGTDGGRLYGFGSLWMPWERRGDFSALWARLRNAYFPPSEVKWQKVKKNTLPFFEALVDEFFRRKWLMFHCIIIGKDEVNLAHHDNDWDLARRKHLVLLLHNKICRFARPGKRYRIRVDPLPSRYAKADEAAEIILSRLVAQAPNVTGGEIIQSLRTVDSKKTPGIQLSDLLLGAVVAARRGEATSQAKLSLMERIARHLGWADLASDTFPEAGKFNIWRYWDPASSKPRPEITRRCTLHW